MTLSLTVILISIISIVSIMAFSNAQLLNRLIFHPYTIKRENQWYRFLTSAFIHGDWVHLIFNMFTMYWFGRLVEYGVVKPRFGDTTGGILYIALFVIGVIVAHLPSYQKHKDSPYYRSLGASGGVSALLFCSIMFFPLEDICIYGILCIPGFIIGPLYLIYTYFQGKRNADNINHEAHLYGALFGILFSILVEPTVISDFIHKVSQWKII